MDNILIFIGYNEFKKWLDSIKLPSYLNIGLNNCTGDICIKFDIDFIFNSKDKEKFANQFKNRINEYHVYYLPRINFMNKKYGSLYKKGLYAINTTLLKKENKTYLIELKKLENVELSARVPLSN